MSCTNAVLASALELRQPTCLTFVSVHRWCIFSIVEQRRPRIVTDNLDAILVLGNVLE